MKLHPTNAWLCAIAGLCVIALLHGFGQSSASGREMLELTLRSRTSENTNNHGLKQQHVQWDPSKTAVVICDMWDDHWCQGAARRVSEMAKRVDELAAALRSQGALIVHAPSSVVDHYDGRPQRARAQNAPLAKTPIPLSTSARWGTCWCWPDPTKETDLPIDDSDMGCDCPQKCVIREAWSRQIDTIQIAAQDVITDDGQEFYNVLQQNGIDNVIIMGVHLNMCVLGRPFGIRQTTKLGKNVALVRDLTDTMYNHEMRPFVNHFTGNDLVVEHVEKYWCPTLTSDQILGGKPYRFQEDSRK